MSCMTWWNRVWRRLHPGKQLASVGLGWKWIQILGFMFSDWLIEFHTLHVTVQDFFFFSGVPEDLRGFCAVPLVLGAVQCHCHAVWWAHTSPFCQFFVKSTPVLWTLGTLRLVLLHQVSLTWIDKCVKERFSSDLSASIFPHSWNQMMGCGAVVQGTAFEKCYH